MVMAGMTDFLTAAQAAQLLGVKPATLYAYVSRGLIGRSKSAVGQPVRPG
jgi:citrate synthase